MIINRNKKALVYKDRSYDYSELLQYSYIYSEAFTKVSPKAEKVVIFLENCPEYVFAIYGIYKNKSIIVPVDVSSTVKEFSYIIEDCRPEIIFSAKEKMAFISECLSNIEGYNPSILYIEDIDISGVGAAPIVEIPFGEDENTTVIIYTSGTTGTPKGVMISNKNLWYNMDAVSNQIPIYKFESNVICLLPLHHIFPFAGCILIPFYVGATVYMTENIVPETIIRVLNEGKITTMIGVPRLYDALAKGIINKINASRLTKTIYKIVSLIGSDSVAKKVFKSVHDKFGGNIEFFVSGGAALPLETGEVFKNLGFYVLEGYGMSECAPMISFTRPGERKVGYCGRLLPGLELKIDENSEVCVKGPNVMTGYYNRPEETAQIIRDGWLHTGDTGIYDEKYGMKLTGRIKEIIVTSNGKNINPAEIENEILQKASAIKEIAVFLNEGVLQAVVFPEMNYIRANTNVSIRDSIRPEIEDYNKSAMAYKRIMNFHISSNELPKTRLGKIQRHRLKEVLNIEQIERKKEDLSGKSEIYLNLKELIDAETKKDAHGEDHFEIDLALDSLGKISFLAAIENQYHIVIKETDFDLFPTLNLLSDYIEKNCTEYDEKNQGSWKEILENNNSKLDLPRSGIMYNIFTKAITCLLHIYYRYTSTGKENLPSGPCIYACNHSSSIDAALIISKFKWSRIKNIFFFAKEIHFKGRTTKFLARNNNIILMDINSNVKNSIEQLYQVLKNGKSIVIFPEGTRSNDGRLKNFKESFVILSQALNIPIVPVAIEGAARAAYKKVRFPRFLAKIKVNYLPAVYSKPEESTKNFKERIKGMISEKLGCENN